MKAIITLLKLLLLHDYPSGSAINYYNEHLYIVGDDANQLLVLDSHYNQVKRIPLFHYEEKRIPKAQKPDLETAVIIHNDGQPNLLAIGSAATKERELFVLLPLQATDSPRYISSKAFIQRLQQLPEINIEGATIAGDHLILGNRGNESHPVNQLVVTTPDCWQHPVDAPVSIATLDNPFSLPGFAGLSELCYVEQQDVLLLTLSSEATTNAYDDGIIGDSYIAWVTNFRKQLSTGKITVNGIVNLSDAAPAFKGEKIEGICLSAIKEDGWYLHLVADDDQGASKLFHIKLLLP